MNHIRLRIARSESFEQKIEELEAKLEHEYSELANWTDRLESMREEKNGRA